MKTLGVKSFFVSFFSKKESAFFLPAPVAAR
jgi:hypothetical protein